MIRVLLFSLLLALILVSSGCAVGNTHDYGSVHVDLVAYGNASVAVGAIDDRPYVIAGTKDPTFVGLQRGGYGNPFDIHTADKRPLAEEFSHAIAAALAERNFKTTPVTFATGEAEESAIQKLRASGAGRLILVRIDEWKSDTYQNTALHYEVSARVYDAQGKALGQKAIQGRDDLKGSFMNPPGHAKKAVPQAFKEKIEELMNDPAVSGALR